MGNEGAAPVSGSLLLAPSLLCPARLQELEGGVCCAQISRVIWASCKDGKDATIGVIDRNWGAGTT